MPFTVALAQMASVTGDKAANLDKFAGFITRAAAEGAQLIVFPELALTGYGCGDAFFDVAEPVPGPSTDQLIALARQRQIHIVWGMPERRLSGVLYNAAVLVGPDGHIGTWRKHTLPGHATDRTGPGAFPDRRFFRAGTHSPVFATPLGRIGLMVCYDVFFPEIARLLTLQGADLLVAISGSPAFEQPIFEPLVLARAMENTTWLAYCNMAGSEAGLDYWGGSRLIAPGDPTTKVPGSPIVCQGPYNEEALILGAVDLDLIHRFRPFFPVLRDIPPAIYSQLDEAMKGNLG